MLETRSHKAHALWSHLDELHKATPGGILLPDGQWSPAASISELQQACGIASKTTVVEQRKAWRATRELAGDEKED